MEFDNDRVRKHANKIEVFYCLFLCLLNPLVNTLSFFLKDVQTGALLLLVNMIMAPGYFLYAGIVIKRFFFRNQYVLFTLASFLWLLLQLLLVGSIYRLLLQFQLTPGLQVYFIFSNTTIARECGWIIINMSLAAAIAFISRGLGDTDLLLSLQKDNFSFKLRYLRAQLNPHFLFNTLNSIYALCLQKSDKAPDLVVRLADLMRYLIYECNEDKVLLSKEIEFIRNYIAIEKIRYKADVKFTIDGDTKGIMIEPFLFISFIENGFKHAFDNSFAEPFIYITIRVAPDQIVLNVINNSSTDLETQAKRINGKGLANSKSLLELLYHDAYALNIIQTEKEDARKNELRLENARKRLEIFYPDSHTLDVILSNNAFTVSLVLKQGFA